MAATVVRICSANGGAFECYLARPETGDPVPAVVLASSIRGVDADILAIAGEFADAGFIVAAPDLFWRSIPGPLSRDDGRAAGRSQPRLEKIKAGEQDMADTLAYLGTLANFNGRATAMGFCYGGPYAVLGPKRLGYDAGISCHGTQMLDYIDEFGDVDEHVCVMWGDRDNRAPIEVIDAYRDLAVRRKNVELHIFPGVAHGYMMRKNAHAFHQVTRDFSMARARAIVAGLRGGRTSNNF